VATNLKSMKSKPGKLGVKGIATVLNKKMGMTVAQTMDGQNPSQVTDWIPTGCTWLDGIICRGKVAGIPVGRITEIAGLESSGKSYMAAQVAANANAKGFSVVYFDSEAAMDFDFLRKAGVDEENFLRVTPTSVENMLETLETILNEGNTGIVFIWDSLANTPTESDNATSFNPQDSMAMKARILSKAMQKLTIPLNESNSTFLVLNQLKTNIPRPGDHVSAMINPFVTPGGKSMQYAASLRIYLTGRKSKASYIMDDNGFRVGSEVKARIKKSRFGSEGRECFFKILWGDEVRIQNEESVFEAIRGSDRLKNAGAWYTLTHTDGTEEKFQSKMWLDKMQDEKFKASVMDIFETEVVLKFAERQGNASEFYDVDGTGEDSQ
jgi:recombination protein RecA